MSIFQPENLLLDTVANRLKLIDFGSAQEVETMRFSVASNASSNTTSSSSSSLLLFLLWLVRSWGWGSPNGGGGAAQYVYIDNIS